MAEQRGNLSAKVKAIHEISRLIWLEQRLNQQLPTTTATVSTGSIRTVLASGRQLGSKKAKHDEKQHTEGEHAGGESG